MSLSVSSMTPRKASTTIPTGSGDDCVQF
uniref:Uncharacterized protein n=1 Tax=Rhizophora mucronata TaxID=61149 RepID=A0A2P2Q5Z1_RHIMU